MGQEWREHERKMLKMGPVRKVRGSQKFPITFSSDLINLLEWVTELR